MHFFNFLNCNFELYKFIFVNLFIMDFELCLVLIAWFIVFIKIL